MMASEIPCDNELKEADHKCQICNIKLDDKSTYTEHIDSHIDNDLNMCSICKKIYTSKASLRKHLRVHIGIKPFVCSECGKRFSEQYNLNAHFKVHSGIKPHKCPTCGKCFKEKGKLTLHTKTHTGEKPHMCEVCGKGFIQHFDLKRHQETHNNYDNSTVCHLCGRLLSGKLSLAYHIKLQHINPDLEKTCTCKDCGKVFETSLGLTHHRMQGKKCFHKVKNVSKNRPKSKFCKSDIFENLKFLRRLWKKKELKERSLQASRKSLSKSAIGNTSKVVHLRPNETIINNQLQNILVRIPNDLEPSTVIEVDVVPENQDKSHINKYNTNQDSIDNANKNKFKNTDIVHHENETLSEPAFDPATENDFNSTVIENKYPDMKNILNYLSKENRRLIYTDFANLSDDKLNDIASNISDVWLSNGIASNLHSNDNTVDIDMSLDTCLKDLSDRPTFSRLNSSEKIEFNFSDALSQINSANNTIATPDNGSVKSLDLGNVDFIGTDMVDKEAIDTAFMDNISDVFND